MSLPSEQASEPTEIYNFLRELFTSIVLSDHSLFALFTLQLFVPMGKEGDPYVHQDVNQLPQ
jgi:hypothetical protein